MCVYLTLKNKVLYKTLIMESLDTNQAIQEIHRMMNRSLKFLSLSGLSGVFAGIYALIAVFIVNKHQNREWFVFETPEQNLKFYITLAIITLVLALVTAFFFTKRKARKNHLSLWNENSKSALLYFLIPLISGGVFCLALLHYTFIGLLAPTALVFYGLGLVSASRYTYSMILPLGILEILLGLVNLFYIGKGLWFWAMGFGVLHIAYEVYMYVKYDSKQSNTTKRTKF